MGKKKREHVVFDKMATIKKNIPFTKVNRACQKGMIPRKSKGN